MHIRSPSSTSFRPRSFALAAALAAMTATGAFAMPFTDTRDGLVITPPPGFKAMAAMSDSDDELPVSIERDEDSICVATLVRHAAIANPSEAELESEAHSFDAVAHLEPARRISLGRGSGILLQGTSGIPKVHAQVHIALLAFPACRVVVNCNLPTGQTFAPDFEAMVRSIQLPD